MLSIGIIGFGTISQQLVELIKQKKVGDVNVSSILVRSEEKVNELKQHPFFQENNVNITHSPTSFFNGSLDFIVEAAGHEALQQYCQPALDSGSHLIVSSVGVFSDETFLQEVRAIAKKAGTQLIIPSAAIAGLDRIHAASFGDIDEVKQITSKPPKAWYGTSVENDYDLQAITEPQCIFKGSARESARLFPENVNVSAALSLAGIGFEKTNVEVYIDPSIDRNFHEIKVSGLFGESTFHVQNTPSKENPKTGYIVAMSIAKVLKSYTSDIVIGV